eukprot:TRINITY_DN5238_c0_g1_i2.p1 TRINITY_DN5238_c0_g1~~TRINITY_DN5238_c0_g1_i2.p1  ORF type:complete len:183 (-),score=39.87 TRINITY_DN5238_c0_g1_i2:63-611(-)
MSAPATTTAAPAASKQKLITKGKRAGKPKKKPLSRKVRLLKKHPKKTTVKTLSTNLVTSDIIWDCIRKHNSFLIRRDGHRFSSEPGNLTNLHSKRWSGIANKKTIDVALSPDGNGLSMTFKTKGFRKPGHFRTTAVPAENSLTAVKNASRKYGRKGLVRPAVVRAHAISRSAGITKKTKTSA